MNTVKELIKRLEKEDPEAIVLVDGYEYGMEFLRFKNLKKGKFNLPESIDTRGSDISGYGGAIESDESGELNYLLIGRNT
jgi:hypothetical protein